MKDEDGEYDYDESIHDTDELRQDCYRRNKRQQRCQYNRATAIGNLFLTGANRSTEKEEEDNLNVENNYEDNLIELIRVKDELNLKHIKKLKRTKKGSKKTSKKTDSED